MAKIHIDTDLPENDQRVVLSHLLNEIAEPSMAGPHALDEILYTASERGLTEFHLHPDDAILLWKMVELARVIDRETTNKIVM